MWAILAKDLSIELRTREGLVSLFVLGLLVVVVFVMAFPEDPSPETAGAALWLAFVFAGTTGVQRSFLVERENSCLTGLLASPVDPASIYVAKVLGNIVVLGVFQLLVLPVVAILFRVDASASLGLMVVILMLGAIGFSALATLFAAVSANLRAREVMLPLLLFPLLTPLIIAGVGGTTVALSGGSFAQASVWLEVLVAFDVIFAVTGWLLFEYVVRDV